MYSVEGRALSNSDRFKLGESFGLGVWIIAFLPLWPVFMNGRIVLNRIGSTFLYGFY